MKHLVILFSVLLLLSAVGCERKSVPEEPEVFDASTDAIPLVPAFRADANLLGDQRRISESAKKAQASTRPVGAQIDRSDLPGQADPGQDNAIAQAGETP